MYAIYLVAIVALGYSILATIWEYVGSPSRAIPGPLMARVSRLWYFKQVWKGSFHYENIALHKKYGPIVRTAPGYISISAPDKSVYAIGSGYPKGDWYQGWKHPDPSRWTLFPDQDMKRHSETRKRFQSLYSMSSLLSYEGYVDECIDIFLDKLDQFAQKGTSMNLAHWFQCYAFDVIGDITYSERFGFLDDGADVGGTIAALDKTMFYSTLIGIFPKLHPYVYTVMEKIPGSGAAGRTYIMKFVQKKIDERIRTRKRGAPIPRERGNEAPQDFLNRMADAQEKDPDKVTPYHIFMMGLSNIIAGSDTTAISLSSVIYYLIMSPHVLSKLRAEIEDHGFGEKRVTFKGTQAMPYLQDVLKEALRIHPATGLPLWRVVPQGGAQLGDHWLPAGTNVGVNSWVAHYDESVFGEDAHVFRPERWEEARQEGGTRYKSMEANYMPFGLGSRTCLGRHISILEMSKLVPEIVKNFDLTLAMGEAQWSTNNYWFVKPERLPVVVTKRP